MGMIGNTLAQGLISGANIVDGTVDTPDIKDSAVTAAKIANGVVTPGKMDFSAGTANSVPYLNGSKALTTGSAITFDGTSFSFNAVYPYLNNIASGSVKPVLAFNTSGTYYAGIYDSGLTSTAGSRQYFARAATPGAAPGNPVLALDYQNNRVGIGTINPSVDLQVSNPNGASSTLAVKAVSSGVATLNLDSYTTAGGASTQISFQIQASTKYALGYANIGNAGVNDMAVWNYTTSRNPWILTSSDYQRLPGTAAFVATISSNYTSSGSGVVRFDTVGATGCFDNRGNFDTSNYRFVAPVDGWYQFNTVVNQYSISAGSVFEIYFRKNATVAYTGGRIYSGGSGDQQIGATAVIYLSASEYVDVYASTAGGFSNSTRWNTFSGHLIG